MKQLRIFLLAFALLFSVNALMAQEKYDYAAIVYTYNDVNNYMVVSINGSEIEYQEFKKKELEHRHGNLNPMINKLNEMEDQGWELFDTGIGGRSQHSFQVYTYHLRRKEQ